MEYDMWQNSLSFLLIWNWKDKYVHTLRRSLENHTRFQTKMGKVYSAQNDTKTYPTRLGGTYLYGFSKGVPPPPAPTGNTMKCHSSFTFALSPCNVLCSHTSSVKGYLVKDGLVGVKKGRVVENLFPLLVQRWTIRQQITYMVKIVRRQKTKDSENDIGVSWHEQLFWKRSTFYTSSVKSLRFF